jgi:hypothetical protein
MGAAIPERPADSHRGVSLMCRWRALARREHGGWMDGLGAAQNAQREASE